MSIVKLLNMCIVRLRERIKATINIGYKAKNVDGWTYKTRQGETGSNIKRLVNRSMKLSCEWRPVKVKFNLVSNSETLEIDRRGSDIALHEDEVACASDHRMIRGLNVVCASDDGN
ncbi:hypothetical protein TorRG33x02_215000 [Trema orientale]|uniref:Uncharacterized protein n=1 Tax=Trema orientale TaxID=63057 RepID=A0A2P5EB41_TREOI|nr:hypothetical protein TorRG33x02_215000 [Trema orientale]